MDITQACRLIASDYTAWTSHTVVVVDQSGSMRKTDVPGGATRSDAVIDLAKPANHMPSLTPLTGEGCGNVNS